MIIIRIVLVCKGFFDNIINVKVPGMVAICFSYAGIRNGNTCKILRLLQVGTNDEVNKRSKPAVNKGETIFYAYAFVPLQDALDALWALDKHFNRFMVPYQKPEVYTSKFDGVEILLRGNAIPTILSDGDKRFTCFYNK